MMLSTQRTSPWKAFESLMQSPLNLGRQLEQSFFGPASAGREIFHVWPQFNLWSNDDELILTSEIPGLDPDQINIDLNNNQLTVSATVESEQLNDGESVQRRERFSGEFERTIRLPFAVDQENSEAVYKDGVLEIRLHKPERDKPRKLTVNAG